MSNNCNLNVDIPQKINHSLTPIYSGEEKCAPNHFWGPGVRSEYLIHYVVSGKGVFYCGPNKFTLRQGQIFVIFPRTIVKYQADEKNPWHYVWIAFYGEEAKEVFSHIGISLHAPVFTPKNDTKILELFYDMPTQRSANLRENLKFSSILYEFMSLLVENKCDAENSKNDYLKTATRYIKAHYYEDITVDQVAAHVGISRKYLFAIFKNTLGISPKDYIIDYRMKRAAEFLKYENLPVGNIAYSVGYKDSLTFSKMFKRKTGLSPTEYRTQP